MSHSLLQALQSEDARERASACEACVHDPSAVLLLDARAKALGDSEKSVMRAASNALVALSQHHSEVHELLRHALRSPDLRTRWGGTFTSARVQPPKPGMLPTLVEVMASPDGDLRWAAARITVDLARLHDEAFRAVLQLVDAGDPPAVRRMAVFCLRELAPEDPGAAEALVRASRAADLQLRRAALTAIGALSSLLPEAASRLLEATRGDPDPASRRVAALALGQLGAAFPSELPAAVAAELKSLRAHSEDPDLTRALQLALAKLGD